MAPKKAHKTEKHQGGCWRQLVAMLVSGVPFDKKWGCICHREERFCLPNTTRMNAFFTEACLYASPPLFLHISWEQSCVMCGKRYLLNICYAHLSMLIHPKRFQTWGLSSIKLWFETFFLAEKVWADMRVKASYTRGSVLVIPDESSVVSWGRSDDSPVSELWRSWEKSAWEDSRLGEEEASRCCDESSWSRWVVQH